MPTLEGWAIGEHGWGSVTKRPDGRLQVAVTMANGRRVYRMVPKVPSWLTGPERRKAERSQRQRAEELRRQLVDAREADLDPSRLTLAAFLQSWLTSLRESGRVRPRTLDSYAGIAAQIAGAIGGYRLDQLSERHVQRWLDVDHSRSVHHRRNVLRIALGVALRQRLVARNVAVAVDLPRNGSFRGDPLTAAEARALLEATKADRLGALWRLAIVTGLRSGELLGLARDDLDDAGRLHVRFQLMRRNGGWHRAPTKRERRRETIALDAGTVAALREHLRRQAEERTPEWSYFGLMFTTEDGMPISRFALLRAFREACQRAGVRERRLHDLRHANATLMADAGVPEDVRQARLGHSRTETARHYAQVTDAQDRAASEQLARAIG